MGADVYRSDLREVSRELARLDIEREALRVRRDEMIRELRGRGATWVSLQEDTGLTSGAIQGILR